MRAVAPIALAAALLFAAPGVASADVIFDPADAEELAAVLADATAEQDVCYGWDVQVDNVGVPEESVGSNLGAGVPMSSGCDKRVQLNVYITYTSESSESEDSASYDVVSSPAGVTRTDLDSLDIDWDGLTGENPDVVIGKAVTALPLLASDKGLAKPIEAAPETGAAPADAQLTDDPGSDFWRGNGGVVLWGVGLMLAGGLFAWWVLRTNRARRRRTMSVLPPEEVIVPPYIPDTMPDEFYQRPQDPDLAHVEKPDPDSQRAEPEPERSAAEPEETPESVEVSESEVAAEPEETSESVETPEPEKAAEQRAEPEPEDSTVEPKEAPERPAPSDQKDKE